MSSSEWISTLILLAPVSLWMVVMVTWFRHAHARLIEARAALSPAEHEQIYEKPQKRAPLPVARVVRR